MMKIRQYYITHLAMVLLLFALSNLVLQWKSLFLLWIWLISNFFVIAIMPIFRRQPSLWMFVVFAFTSIPLNCFWVKKMLYDVMKLEGIKAMLLGAAVCLGVFCIEEIVLAIVTRLIWKEQKELTM